MQDHNERMNGYIQAMKNSGLSGYIQVCDISGLTENELLDAIKKLFKTQQKKTTAAITVSDQTAMFLSNIFSSLKIKIPDNVSLAGFDDSFYAAYMQPPLTTAIQPVTEMAAKAGQLIGDLLLLLQPIKKSIYEFKCQPVIRSSIADLTINPAKKNKKRKK